MKYVEDFILNIWILLISASAMLTFINHFNIEVDTPIWFLIIVITSVFTATIQYISETRLNK